MAQVWYSYSAFRAIERASRKSAVNACSDRLLYLPTFSKDNDAKKYCSIANWRLKVGGIYLYSLFVLFVALCSALFCFPSFLPSLFLLLLTLSLFCRVELTLTHFFLARKKMDDNNSGGSSGGGF